MEKKKILIMHAPIGMGHSMVAKATEEAFRSKPEFFDVKNIDILDFAIPFFKKGLPQLYNNVSTKIPEIYRWLYNFSNNKDRHKFLHSASRAFFTKKFLEFVEGFSPDFMIATHPLPLHLVTLIKEKHIINIPSANICTDFGTHTLWFNEHVNYYFVANDEVKLLLIDYGVASQNIIVTGIPVGAQFSLKLDCDAIYESLRIQKNAPVILMVGGHFHYKTLEKIVNEMREKNNLIQFLIVSGRDKALYKKLQSSGIYKDSNIKIFGFVDNMHELMAVSDIIFSKAGGSTVAECLAMSLPMIIHRVIPGQEDDNMKYLVKNNVAIFVDDESKISDEALNLLNDHKKLEQMKNATNKIRRPYAALEIMQYIEKVLNIRY